MTIVNITEFRNNIKKYADIAKKDDIEVVNRNEIVFVIKSLSSYKEEAFQRLAKAVDQDVIYENILKRKLLEL